MSVPEAAVPSSPPSSASASGSSATGARACSSCGRTLVGWGIVALSCPKCGEPGLGRCAQCRDQSVPYRCRKCDFQGP